MKKHLLVGFSICLSLFSNQLIAQCNFLSTAVATGDTLHCSGGDAYRTAVTYNPQFSLYYSVNAGGTTAEEVFDLNGDLLYSSTVADWRGLWWNSNINRVEGNAWGNYFYIDSLQSNGYLGGNHSLVGATTPPDVQSAGAYDPNDNIIYYYNGGTLYGESRADFVDITPITLTGIPSFTGMVQHGVIYTGCTGSEIGIYDAGAKILYLFNKSTGAMSNSIAFPSNTIGISYVGGNFSYANDIVWLYNSTINEWVGFNIFGPTGVDELEVNSVEVYPNPVITTMNIKVNEPSQISVVNLLGEVVMNQAIQTESEMDVSKLVPGIYFVKTEYGKTVKILKQ